MMCGQKLSTTLGCLLLTCPTSSRKCEGSQWFRKNPSSAMRSTDSCAINLPLSLFILVFSVLLIHSATICSGLSLCTALAGCFEGYRNNTGHHQANGTLWDPSPPEDMGAMSRGAKTKVAILGRVQNGKKETTLWSHCCSTKCWGLIFQCPWFGLSRASIMVSPIVWRLIQRPHEDWKTAGWAQEVRGQEGPRSAVAG